MILLKNGCHLEFFHGQLLGFFAKKGSLWEHLCQDTSLYQHVKDFAEIFNYLKRLAAVIVVLM